MNPRTSTSLAVVVPAAVLLAIALLATASAAQPSSAAPGQGAAPSSTSPGNPVFARSVAGTWISADFPGYQQLQTISSDGTTSWSNNFEYGGGSGQFLFGAVYGTWQQSGPREMRSVEYGFIYDDDGVHTRTGRVSVLYNFDRAFQSYSGSYVEELFRPDQDPTDPNAVPITSWRGTFTGERVTLSAWSSPTASVSSAEDSRTMKVNAAPSLRGGAEGDAP